MDQNIVSKTVEEICHMVQAIMEPNFHSDSRMKANASLNEILKTKIHTNSDIYLNVAMVLINKIEYIFTFGIVSNEYCMEIIVNYGFNILENLVKYQWYNLNKDWKEQLKTFSINCCNSRLFDSFLNPTFQSKLSTSTLILNTCSRLITEIFIREWPNYWSNFLAKITQNCSLVTLYTLLNISDYLHKMFLPDNSNRRKEITKVFTYEKDTVLEYFFQCLSIMDITNEQVPPEYKKFVIVKSLEALDSLLEWYPLNEKILMIIISIASPNHMSFEDQFSYQIKLFSLRCIQTIIKRQVKRVDDSILINDTFFDLSETKFSHYLVTKSLSSYLNLIKPIESNNEIFELFILLLDISTEVICRVINLFNQESTHKSIIKNCTDNQLFWSKFIAFCFDCLEYNNANFDEILLRFFILYSKSNPPTPGQSSNVQDSIKKSSENQTNKLSLPISYDLNQSIPLKLMLLIGCLKIEPKTKACATELLNFYNLDSYESYLQLFKDNKCKFVLILNNFIQNYPEICRMFSLTLLRDLLGPLPIENLQDRVSTNIKSWNIAATLCSTLIPKQQFSPEHIKILEFYFSLLLEIMQDSDRQTDTQTLNSVLSCISSMFPFYNSFSNELIEKLIDTIFFLTVNTSENQYDQNVSDLQNHLNALFIKLTKNCTSLFLPYFQMMRQYIENLIENDKISLIQSYFLYEGLFILSNHLPIEEQRSFLIDHFLPKIIWITTYDFGQDGKNFFIDIGLSKEPLLNVNHLPSHYYKTFVKMSALLNLLNRLYKRIHSSRCLEILWPTMFDYVTPFYKVVALIHELWFHYERKNQSILDQHCHPFYQRYFFEEIPFYYLSMICSDQSQILPTDKYKSLLKKWDRQSPPSPELIGYFMQHRIWVFYSQSINFLNTILSYLLFFYTNNPSLETHIENYINTSNSLICSKMKFMPLFVYHDLIRSYFQCLANYSPRSEKFLFNSGCIETLVQFMEFIFCRLDENLKAIQQEKDYSIANSEPSLSKSSSFNLIRSLNSDDNQKYCFEIHIEAIVNSVCLDFVSFLNNIFSPLKNIGQIINKYESIHDVANEIDEEMSDDIQQTKYNELTISENNIGEYITNSNDNKYNEEDLLSKFIITYNAKPLVLVVIGCLVWPISNLRLLICDVNNKLICSLISRQMINSVNAFFDLSGRILQAISLTKRSDPDILNRLVNLLFLIYEKVAFKNNLTNIVNIRLSQVCGSDLNQWNKFSECFRNNTNMKKTQKILRSLVEDVSFKELSMTYSIEKSNVISLGMLETDKIVDEQDTNNLDAGFLSWL